MRKRVLLVTISVLMVAVLLNSIVLAEENQGIIKEDLTFVWSDVAAEGTDGMSFIKEVLTEVPNINTHYAYNDSYNRISKSVNDEYIVYKYDEASNLISESRKGYEISYNYSNINGRYLMSSFTINGETYYYERNENDNSVAAITDTKGKLVARYVYENGMAVLILGENKTGSWIDMSKDESFIGTLNLIRFNSYYYDDETGLYYDGKYYYDSVDNEYIVNNNIVLDDIDTVEEFYQKYGTSYSTRSLNLNQVDAQALQWTEDLLDSSTYGASISYSSGWYSSLSEVEILARLIYGENTYTDRPADRSSISFVLINRKNANSSEYRGASSNTFENIATYSGQFATITGDSGESKNAREPLKSSSSFEEATYYACVMLLTTNNSYYETLIGNPIDGECFFNGMAYFMGTSVTRDNSGNTAVEYLWSSWTELTQVTIVESYSNVHSNLTSKQQITNLEGDSSKDIVEGKNNIFFDYH